MTTTEPGKSAHAERREPAAADGPVDLLEIGHELLAEAADLSSGRLARTLTPSTGGPLKQTVLAITGGNELAEHDSPGAATLQVLEGAVTVTTADGDIALASGQWARVPARRHGLRADEDAIVLMTVAP